ncbi:MAG TPA: hypothetical protein VNA69_10110 [Thermoanaerobaculia bacterium]|nr:hypothetical protein [Thermoanaerobaculia bacterium]
MATREQLTALLAQLLAAPHDGRVRSAVDAALAEISDANLLAEVLQDFVVELPVAEAIERRLTALNSSNPLAWVRVARALAHYVDSEDKRDHVMALVRRVLAQHPDNSDALALGILLWAAPSRNAPRMELMEWSERYVDLNPRNPDALSMRAKMLLQLDGEQDAIRFLAERLRSEQPDSDLAGHLQELLGRIKAGEDILRQWP